MKKVLLVIMTLLVSLFIWHTEVNATIQDSAGGSASGGYGSGIPGWYWIGDNSAGLSLRGVRITLYEYYQTGPVSATSTAKKSIDFLPDSEFETYLSNNDVNYYTQRTSRLEYSRNNYTNISYGKITSDIIPNTNIPMFGESGQATLRDFFDPSGASFNLTTIQNIVANFDPYKTNSGVEYYYVVEPLSLVKLNGFDFYGTSYEQAKFIAQKGWVSMAESNIPSHPYHYLPMAYYVSEGTIKNPDTAGFKKFLASVGVYANSYASDDVVNNCNETSEELLCVHNNEVLSQTYGMGILWDRLISEKTESCNYNFNSNKCGNIGIVEPDSKACVLGRDINYFSSYNETGQIYCTNNISTNFDEFYNDLNSSSIRTGSYFEMKNLYVTTNKTCYIKTNDLNSVMGWESSIYENLSGNIKLTLGNRTYNLQEKIENDPVVCQEHSNGICTKATLNTTHSYYLNYLTNRFINLETLAQDTVTCPEDDIDRCKTHTNRDNGGPRLTVPLNYSNGIYKYKLDLKGSLLFNFISRIRNNDRSVVIDGIPYKLTYTTNKTISDSDLSFSCPYKVTQDQCEDENGNLVPCPVDDCANLPEDKCCINGKVADCPVPCSGECCDSNGNEIECPGGESIIGNIIYRPISLTNPFPGIEGGGRLPGSNWDKIVTINGRTYSASEYYIKYNRGYNDYEVYQTEPLYVIKLDTNKIKAIREYNDYKDHNYNDFDLECDNGKNCISKFLRGRADHFSINLIDSGTCKNINPRTFDSCITRKN